jgi:hypothetical protein
MRQSPSLESNSRSASQEISRRLWNQKLHCPSDEIPPYDPILSQMNPRHPHTVFLCGLPSGVFRLNFCVHF